MLGGDFYHSLFIDQISVYIKIVLIFPENSLKVIYTKPDTNNSYGIILFIIYLAVHKNSDVVIGIDHFIVIHIEGNNLQNPQASRNTRHFPGYPWSGSGQGPENYNNARRLWK